MYRNQNDYTAIFIILQEKNVAPQKLVCEISPQENIKQFYMGISLTSVCIRSSPLGLEYIMYIQRYYEVM